MPLFYIFMLLETCCSQTDDYVTNKLSLEQADEKIQKVRKVWNFLHHNLLVCKTFVAVINKYDGKRH